MPTVLPGTPPLQELAEITELTKELKKLSKEMRKTNALHFIIFKALITGLATVIGATLLLSLFVLALRQLSYIEAFYPIVNEILTKVKVNE